MTRDQAADALWERLREAQALAYRAQDAARASVVCSSWAFGDESACAALRANASRLSVRVSQLAEQLAQVTSAAEPAPEQLSRLDGAVQLVADEASYIAEISAEAGTWRELARETLREFAQLVASAAVEVASVAVDAAGAVAEGVARGLGPVGVLVVAVVLVLLLRKTA